MENIDIGINIGKGILKIFISRNIVSIRIWHIEHPYKDDYTQMSTKLNGVVAELIKLGDSVMKQSTPTDRAADTSQKALKLAEKTKGTVKYIEEELVLIVHWRTRVKEAEDIFMNELDLLQYIELSGKAETVNMLCELSTVCTQYMEHKHKYAGKFQMAIYIPLIHFLFSL